MSPASKFQGGPERSGIRGTGFQNTWDLETCNDKQSSVEPSWNILGHSSNHNSQNPDALIHREIQLDLCSTGRLQNLRCLNPVFSNSQIQKRALVPGTPGDQTLGSLSRMGDPGHGPPYTETPQQSAVGHEKSSNPLQRRVTKRNTSERYKHCLASRSPTV